MKTSPVKYKNEVLIEYVKGLLTNGVMNVNEVAEFLGYYDAAYFSKVFKSAVGISPGNINNPKLFDLYFKKRKPFDFVSIIQESVSYTVFNPV